MVACSGCPTSFVCTSGRFSPGCTITTAQGVWRLTAVAVPPKEHRGNCACYGANDQEVDPERLGGGDDQLARITHFNSGVIEVSWVGMPAGKACIFVAISSSIRTIWVSR